MSTIRKYVLSVVALVVSMAFCFSFGTPTPTANANPANFSYSISWQDGRWTSGIISETWAEGCQLEKDVPVIETTVVTYKRATCTTGYTKFCIVGQTERVGTDPARWSAWCYTVSNYSTYLQQWDALKNSGVPTNPGTGTTSNNTGPRFKKGSLLDDIQLNIYRSGAGYFEWCADGGKALGGGATPDGTQVTWIGDSITNASKDIIATKFPGVEINAMDGRGWDEGITALQNMTTVREYVVFALGANSSGLQQSDINTAINAIKSKGAEKIVFVTNIGRGNDYTNNNNLFNNAKADSIVVADWFSAVKDNRTKYLRLDPDGVDVHPTNPDGTTLFATTVYTTLSSIWDSGGVGNGPSSGYDDSDADFRLMADPDGNAIKIYQFFKEKGLDDIHTAAVVGNMLQEHGFETTNVPLHPCGAYECGGLGITQWTGGRQQGVRDYAASQGKSAEDLMVQLEFNWAEMTGEGPAAAYANTQYDHAKFLEITDLEQATRFYGDTFERGVWADRRLKGAKIALELFGGMGGYSRDCDGGLIKGLQNLDVAAKAREMASWGGKYYWSGGHGGTDDLRNRIDAKFADDLGVDCSGFVRAVIYAATGIDVGGLETPLKNNSYFTEVTDRKMAQPGDVYSNDEHMGIIISYDNGGDTYTTAESMCSDCTPNMDVVTQKIQDIYSGLTIWRYNGGKN
jgi:hypothetical protein